MLSRARSGVALNLKPNDMTVHIATRFTAALLLLLSIDTASVVAGGKIEGKIIDGKTREPLVGVSVALKGTGFGDATNLQGFFTIPNLAAGVYILQASLIGYTTVAREVVLEDGETLTINLSLSESSVQGKEVEVIAIKPRQQKEDTRPSVYKIDPKETKVLAGGFEDVLRSLQAIPGVLTQNDFSSQLFVRGSGPDQNLLLLDDIEVFNPYRLYGAISMFNPQTVSDVSLITGGFPAKYGDRLSAVLDITNREGTRERPLGAIINANITDANIVLDGRAPFGLNGSWLISARRTYYDLIVGPVLKSAGLVEGNVAFPNFTDFQTKLAFDITPEHRLQAIGVMGRDAVNIISSERDEEVPDSINVGNATNNDVAGLSWRYTPNKNVFNKFTASWYRNSGDTQLGGSAVDNFNYPQSVIDSLLKIGVPPSAFATYAFDSQSSFAFTKTSFRNDFSVKLPRQQLETGAGVDFLNTAIYFLFKPNGDLKSLLGNNAGNTPFGAIPLDSTVEQSRGYYRANFYVQDRYELLQDRLYIQPGIRFDYYAIIDRPYISPRLNFSYALNGRTTLRGAWGIYYQSPGYEKLIDQAAQGQLFDLSQNSEFIQQLKAERAYHFILGLDRWLDDKWLLKGEAYYKRFTDLIVQQKGVTSEYETAYLGGDAFRRDSWATPYLVTQERLTTTAVNDGTGEAYGAEVFLEKRLTERGDKFSGWVSYAIAWANRYRDGLTIPFTYDQRHTVNIVGNYKLNDWLDLGVRWRYGSGFPFTPTEGVAPRISVIKDANGTEQGIVQTSLNPQNPFDTTDTRVVFNRTFGDESLVNSERYPAYHRLDIRLTAGARFWGAQWAFYLDVINVYNRTNVISYQYGIQDDGSGSVPTLRREQTGMLPLVPTIGVSAVF